MGTAAEAAPLTILQGLIHFTLLYPIIAAIMIGLRHGSARLEDVRAEVAL